jgi:predicted membrane-bound spermidine synthase
MHPLVSRIIGADIVSLMLVIVGGAIWPQINLVGGYLLCMGGTLEAGTKTSSAVPGQVVGVNSIICTQSGVSENIIYAAMALSFVVYSVLFGGIAAVKYVIDEKSN